MVKRKTKTVVCCQEKTIKQYEGVLCHLYDEMFEIDIAGDESRIILYTKEKPCIPSGIKGIDCFFEQVAACLVAEEDREEFLRVCRRSLFCECLENQEMVCLEYREYLSREKTGWVQAEIVPIGDQRLLFLVKQIMVSEYKLFKSMVDLLIFKQNDQYLELDEDEKNLLLKNAIYEAKTDSLTLLYNQKAMKLLVNHRLDCHNRGAIIFIDLDDFKMINDQYGHLAGDEVLKRVARSFCESVGPGDMAGRIGGDEFVLFLAGDDYESGEELAQAVHNLCRNIRESIRMAAAPEHLTCSIGVSLFPDDGREYSILVEKADQALYDAKKMGKDQCVFYSQKTNQ